MMKQFAAALLCISALASQSVLVSPPVVATTQPVANVVPISNRVSAPVNAQVNPQVQVNNNAQANPQAHMQNVVKIDNDFLLQLIALKQVAMHMNSGNALAQLITLHALWNNSEDMRALFHNVDLSAANVGLYYDPSTQSFALVDLASNARTDINALQARLQALAAQGATVDANVAVAPAQSGLISQLPIVGPLLTGLPIVGPLLRSLGN